MSADNGKLQEGDDGDDIAERLAAWTDPDAHLAPQLLATLFFVLGAAVVNTFSGGGLTVTHIGGVLCVAVAAGWVRGQLAAVL